MDTTKTGEAGVEEAAGFRVSVDGGEPCTWEEFAAASPDADLAAIRRDLAECGEHIGGGGAGAAFTVHALLPETVETRAAHDLAVLVQYREQRVSNLGRFALALAAGNTPEDAATMARVRATADRVEFAIEAALDRSGR